MKTNKSENKLMTNQHRLIKRVLLKDFAGQLKGQIIFISPGDYAELLRTQVVGEKEEI